MSVCASLTAKGKPCQRRPAVGLAPDGLSYCPSHTPREAPAPETPAANLPAPLSKAKGKEAPASEAPEHLHVALGDLPQDVQRAIRVAKTYADAKAIVTDKDKEQIFNGGIAFLYRQPFWRNWAAATKREADAGAFKAWMESYDLSVSDGRVSQLVTLFEYEDVVGQTNIPKPTNERQARAMRWVDNTYGNGIVGSVSIDVLRIAHDVAAIEGRKLSARHIKEAAIELHDTAGRAQREAEKFEDWSIRAGEAIENMAILDPNATLRFLAEKMIAIQARNKEAGPVIIEGVIEGEVLAA